MCGLTGFWQSGGFSPERATVMLEGMATAIAHRGPDDAGVWVDADAGIGLAHRRLSILDLSPAGHQPMQSSSGRYVIVFNGEIYNYQELRRELENIHPHSCPDAVELSSEVPSPNGGGLGRGCDRAGELPVLTQTSKLLTCPPPSLPPMEGGANSTALPPSPPPSRGRESSLAGEGSRRWRGQSDTEVMLAAFDAWGVKASLQRLVGMFAFALWDRAERTLTLARDRLGEKPLYYGWSGGVFLFGSELKALRAHPAFRADIDRNALTLLLRHSYIPAPYSIYQGIHKLLPATFVTLNEQALNRQANPVIEPYWSFREVAETGSAHPLALDVPAAITELDALLRDAVARQMVADVPLGAFFSGGVDSSAIVALMQAQSSRPVKTFTIGFHETGYNEACYAKAIAQHLGTDHTELYVTPQQALAVIPRLPQLYDEPFSDSSQIPTFLVSQLARTQVTVCLSGDAGDELFGGYNRYFVAERIWNQLNRFPVPLRGSLARLLFSIPAPWLGRGFAALCPLLPQSLRYPQAGDKLHKLAELLILPTTQHVYRRLVSHWDQPEQVVIGGQEAPTVMTDALQWARLPDFTSEMMYLDTLSYLPDDILVKVDRAAMGVSLETRVPFLDHRLVEFASRVPLSMKVHNGQGKWLLRQLLYQYVPPKMIERPKMGFGVPIGVWLRGPLREWAEDLLDESRLRQEGFFNPEPIRCKWLEHLSGTYNWHYYLWDVLMFQAWRKNNDSDQA